MNRLLAAGPLPSRTRIRTSAMSTGKLILFIVGWTLASMAIGVVTAIVGTEVLRAVGIVETGTPGYNLSLNIITFATFVVLVSVPFVFRKRFVSEESDDG